MFVGHVRSRIVLGNRKINDRRPPISLDRYFPIHHLKLSGDAGVLDVETHMCGGQRWGTGPTRQVVRVGAREPRSREPGVRRLGRRSMLIMSGEFVAGRLAGGGATDV